MDIIIKKPTEAEKSKMLSCPTWECEASEFNWRYDSEETCLLVEGEVEVKHAGGSAFCKAGDMVTFPEGLSCVWKVTKPVKKHYIFK
ncbi:MAG: cupin domain-containing protein [Spirochaetes bacterium]|nr:cupin domain-containing protein [Spirochaetota bacterium]